MRLDGQILKREKDWKELLDTSQVVLVSLMEHW